MLSTSEVSFSRWGAIQIYLYLYLYSFIVADGRQRDNVTIMESRDTGTPIC